MDWFLYDNGLRHERVKYHAEFEDHSEDYIGEDDIVDISEIIVL